MVWDVAGLANPSSFLKKRSLDVGSRSNLLLMHVSVHASGGYWEHVKAWHNSVSFIKNRKDDKQLQISVLLQ